MLNKEIKIPDLKVLKFITNQKRQKVEELLKRELLEDIIKYINIAKNSGKYKAVIYTNIESKKLIKNVTEKFSEQGYSVKIYEFVDFDVKPYRYPYAKFEVTISWE